MHNVNVIFFVGYMYSMRVIVPAISRVLDFTSTLCIFDCLQRHVDLAAVAGYNDLS